MNCDIQPLVDQLRGRPADLPLIRQQLLEHIERLRAAAAAPQTITDAIDAYQAYTTLEQQP